MNDIRFAFRQLLKNPGFTAVAVLTLALGIGANTATFSLVNEQFLRPMQVKEPKELLGIVLIDKSGDFSNQRIPYPIYKEYQEQSHMFSELLAYANVSSSVEIGANSRVASVQLASANYFSALGAMPVQGRTFFPEDDQSPGQPPLAVISHALWQNDFKADPSVIGKTFSLAPSYVAPLTCTVIGVAPPGFVGLDEDKNPDVWLPAAMGEHFRKAMSVNFRMVGRLAPQVSRNQAVAALDLVARNIAEKYRGVPIQGYGNEGIFRSDLRTELRHAAVGSWGAFKPHAAVKRASFLALAVVGMVLLIACANVSNLLLARAVKRKKEIAIRLSLGASRWQLIRQMLTESLLLALIGAAVGILVAHWLNHALVAFKPANLELVVRTALDHRVIGFTLLVAFVAALIFGTAPASQATRCDLNSVLKDELSLLGRSSRFQLRDALVVAQIALCLLLLIGAGLCGRSFAELTALNPGFNTSNLIVVPLHVKGLSNEFAGRFYHELAQRLNALPGIRSVSYTRFSPLLESGSASFPAGQIDGYTPRKNEFINVHFAEVGPAYFETMGIPIIQAPEAVGWSEDAQVIWVNESFAKRYWPGQAPVGKRVRGIMVSGVVKDSQISSPTEPPGPFLYMQMMQIRAPSLTLVVRTEAEARTAMSTVRHEILRSNPDLDLTRMKTMRAALGRSLRNQKFLLALLGAFAFTATLLAVLGIYGVMSHSVAQRTREIGIRMAVGAKPRNVLALILKHGVLLTAIGTALGLFAAVAATRLLKSVLYGVAPTDVATFLVVSLLLAAVAFIACLLPARRAAKVHPMEALRYE